jgi:hypothetical protein
MAVEKELEKSAGTVEVISGEADGDAKVVYSMQSANKTSPAPADSSPHDHDPTTADPENAAKLRIDRSVAEIAQAMKRETGGGSGNMAAIVGIIYERNMHACLRCCSGEGLHQE